LHGWRRAIFGAVALELKHGKALIGMENSRATIVRR
jgi:hypothetical protein